MFPSMFLSSYCGEFDFSPNSVTLFCEIHKNPSGMATTGSDPHKVPDSSIFVLHKYKFNVFCLTLLTTSLINLVSP